MKQRKNQMSANSGWLSKFHGHLGHWESNIERYKAMPLSFEKPCFSSEKAAGKTWESHNLKLSCVYSICVSYIFMKWDVQM